jgi:rod shape determining protein RodA
MPVVGITLPFVSYGGSSLLVLLLGIGLVMNVSMRRFLF